MINPIQSSVVFKGGLGASNQSSFSGAPAMASAKASGSVRQNYLNTIGEVAAIQNAESRKIAGSGNKIDYTV